MAGVAEKIWNAASPNVFHPAVTQVPQLQKQVFETHVQGMRTHGQIFLLACYPAALVSYFERFIDEM